MSRVAGRAWSQTGSSPGRGAPLAAAVRSLPFPFHPLRYWPITPAWKTVDEPSGWTGMEPNRKFSRKRRASSPLPSSKILTYYTSMEDSGWAEWLDWHGAKPEVLPEEACRLPLPYAHFLSSAAAAVVLLSLLHRYFMLKERSERYII